MLSDLSLFDDETPDADDLLEPTSTDLSTVEIRRSAKRRKSVIAFREGGKTIVVAPMRMTQSEVDAYVRELVGRLDRRAIRNTGADALMVRAQRLVALYFEHDVIGLHHVPVQIKWVTNQNTRWGSCTPGDGMIRISHRLNEAPDYVIDGVLMHELAHLRVLGHGPDFRRLIERYPDYERVEAFLAGYSLAQRSLQA